MTSDSSPPTPRRLLREIRPGRLIQNALALMLSSVGTALLGVFFWGLATHLSPASAVGKTSAEITSMVLLANLAQLSFSSIFERFLPTAGRQTAWFVKRAYLMCVAAGVVFAVAYEALGFGRNFLPSSALWRTVFVLAVVLWTIFVLQDSVLIGLRASRWVPVENIIFSLAKLALVPACIALSSRHGIFVAWTAPVGPVVLVVTWYLFRRQIPAHERLGLASEDLPRPRELLALAGAQYATLLFWAFSPSIITLIVIQRLGPVANAHYYVPALIESGLYMILLSIGRSFLVEASHEPARLRRHARTTLRAMTLVLIPSVALGSIFAPAILKVFGSGYAESGVTLLRFLLLSLPGSAVMVFYSTFAWLDKRVWQMTLRSLGVMIVDFTLIFMLIGHQGILSIGTASLVSSGLQALVFVPLSVRRFRRAPVEFA